MIIGEMPGARIAGLLDVGAAGQGNCPATMFVPSATWMVPPFWAGVTVTVPCAVLGAGAEGVDGGCGVGDAECAVVGVGGGTADGDGALDVVPGPFPESGAEADGEADSEGVAEPAP
jgi:hypothetical protein